MSYDSTSWNQVETGVYKHSCRPKTYYVIARLTHSTAVKKCTVYGTLADARGKRDALLSVLKRRSLIEPNKYKHIWKAIGYYIHKHYSKTKQYRIGSGRSIMRYWISEIGDKAPKELRAYHINQCIREMEERGYKASGIVPYVSRLRTALDYARSEGKISISNDLWDEVVKIEPKATKKLIFGTEILGPIMAKMPEYALRIIRYKSLVPCRLLELYEAKSEHIDLVRRVFKITRDKNGNERYLPIPAGLYHEFEEAISCGSEWVFYRTETRKDKVYHYPLSRNHLTVLWAKAAKECGIDGKIKLRMLRHLAISEWLKHAGEAVTSEVAGANSDTMRSYYNMIPVSALVSAADKMAQIGGTLGEPSGKIVAFRSREVSASD